MRKSRTNSFKRYGDYVEVAIDSSSSYLMVAELAANALQLEFEQDHYLKIFRCNGIIVSDSSIPTTFGNQPWTWKGYMTLMNKYSSHMKLGVGYVYVS